VEHHPQPRSFFNSTLEMLAIAGPVLCAIHCLALPVLIASMPLIGLQHWFHGIDEQLLTSAMLVICVPVLVPGFLKHRKKRVPAMMVAAFFLIFLAHYLEHSIDQTRHTVVALFGSALLLKANLDNYRFTHRHSQSCGHRTLERI
jgi:Na+-translocating ferredoxin:NAD+ oxidoreductase RnfD subunit